MFITGILIVLSVFVIQFTTYGSAQSFGVMYLELLRVFKESESNTSWIASLYSGMMFGIGLPCSLLQRRFGVRVIAICGSLFLTGGLFSSAFVTSLFHLYITYGLLAGTGAGMLLYSGTCAINLYFNKGRQQANYLATSGLSVGTIFNPILLNFFIDKYGWRGTFICVSAIASHTLAAAFLLKDKRRQEKSSVITKPCEQLYTNRTCVEIPIFNRYERQNVNTRTSKNETYKITMSNLTNQIDNLREHRQRASLETTFISEGKLGTHYNFVARSNKASEKRNILRISTIRDELYNSQKKIKSTSQNTCLGNTKSVFSNLRYILFTCGETYVVMFVYFIPFLYLPNLVTSLGSSDSTATLLLTVAGVSSLTTRIVNAFVSHKRKINYPLVNGIGLIIGGALTMVCTFLQSEVHLFLYATYLGIFTAITSTVQSLIVREIVGLELFSLAWGYTTLTSGIMAIAGPPIAGTIADVSSGYSVTFQYAGGMFIIAGISSVLVSVIKSCRRKIVPISRK